MSLVRIGTLYKCSSAACVDSTMKPRRVDNAIVCLRWLVAQRGVARCVG